MRIRSRFLLVGLAISLLALRGWAQDPAPTPDPGPAPASPGSYPDIDALREPGSSAKFFATPTPSPSLGFPGQGGATGRNGQHNNGQGNNGQHHHNGRSNDVLMEQVDADPLEVRVAYRRDKTMAMVRDPGLAELLHQAAAAGTEVQKRAVLKEYYTRLYAEIRKVDPSPEMKAHVELLTLVTQQRYDPQRRTVGGEEDIVRGGSGRRGRAQ